MIGLTKQFSDNLRMLPTVTRVANQDFGSCNATPDVVFALGLDGRKDPSFQAKNNNVYNHGSALGIGVITSFICQQLNDRCKAPKATLDACASGQAAAAKTTGGAAADNFNSAFGITTNFASGASSGAGTGAGKEVANSTESATVTASEATATASEAATTSVVATATDAVSSTLGTASSGTCPTASTVTVTVDATPTVSTPCPTDPVTVTVTGASAVVTSTATSAASEATTTASAAPSSEAASTSTSSAATPATTGAVSTLDFGSCTDPTIEFGPAFEGRKAAEFSNKPVNKQEFNQASALNVDIVTRAVCNILASKCKAPQATLDACAKGQAAASAATAKTGAQADAFNAALGITTNFATIPAAPGGGPGTEALATTPNFGTCTNPTMEFGVGFDGRTEASFQPANKADFNHGSALNPTIIATAICDTFVNSCNANKPAIDNCAAAKAAITGLTGQAVADAFNAAVLKVPLFLGQTLQDSAHHDACADRRAAAMPEEYRHQAPPTKHPNAAEKGVARESWIVVSPGAMSPDPVHRPSLENGSIRLISPQPRVVQAELEGYRPPPPLIDPTSRTSSTGSIPHGAGPPTAVTPANPNYKIAPDLTQNVVQVTRDRPHDAASIHVPPTPREAIGHLDAAQLHAKEERENAVLRKRNRGSGMLGSMFGSHEPRSSMEEIESIHSTHAPEKERHGFRSLFGTSREKEREKEKEREREQTRHRGIENLNDRTQWEMSRLIGYTTSTSVEDWSVVMEICDKVNLSDTEAKEASKALRKDIQFGRPAVQLSAARLWAILMRNCGQYFVAQTTHRKFLGKIEEVALSPATSPVVRDRLVEVIGTSVYLLRESRNLKPYQSTWKKLRLQLKLTHPVEGLEIPADDPILNPTPHRPPSSLRQLSPNELVQPEVTPNIAIVTQGLTKVELEPTPPLERRSARDDERERRRDKARNAESTYGVISPEEDIRRLFEECDIARDNSRILADSLVYATPDSIATNTVIKEFREKCMKSQEIIGAQIDWATAIADRARAEQLPLSGSGEIPPTAEEQLLQALVTANGELNDVFKTYDDLERIAISEREEAEVRARSKVELRLDRTKYQQLDGGEVYMIPPDNHGPSRSQTHTPAPVQTQVPTPGHTRRPLPQPTPLSPHVNSLAPPPPAPHGPRPLSRNRTPSPNLGSDVRDHSTDESSQESEVPTAYPSEKAMGKRRAEPPPEEEDEWPEHGSLLNLDGGNDGDDDDGNSKPQEVFLYDAAEERKKQRALEAK
ncbi:unnamed protein product [Rhizoctonia solani]|uniref:VHS domain-containing protein n=1 Tax=Rhizoctonia solani TaxID=456999 RepID=A0A8H3C0Z5_9AGAM|nr:unnamed protein product [Rhizoctonia solani]